MSVEDNIMSVLEMTKLSKAGADKMEESDSCNLIGEGT